MKTTAVLKSDISMFSALSAKLSIGAIALAFVSWFTLHIVSPEYDPAWRMMSEYANGEYPWLLILMFIGWGLGTFTLAVALRSQLATRAGKVGFGFLIAASIGQCSAALFDINHPLHNLTSFVGIGGFAVGAMLVSRQLARTQGWMEAKKLIMTLAHLVWISIVLMIVSFILLISTYIAAGGDTSAGPVSTLPDGVIAVVGYANRFLFLAFCSWVVVIAMRGLKLRS